MESRMGARPDGAGAERQGAGVPCGLSIGGEGDEKVLVTLLLLFFFLSCVCVCELQGGEGPSSAVGWSGLEGTWVV